MPKNVLFIICDQLRFRRVPGLDGRQMSGSGASDPLPCLPAKVS